jgi:protein-S-isoprenylcysteine O-methyltransferase Ste14
MRKNPFILKVNRFLEHYRVRLTTIIVILLFAEDILEGIHPHEIDKLQDKWGLIGLLMVLFGVAIRSWAAGVIHKCEQLATKGPYSISRHPLYLGSLLIAIGFCTILADEENIFIVPIMFLLLYIPTILKEERELREKFTTQWEKYSKNTSFFFPKKLPYNFLTPWSFSQWLKNREYRALSTGCVSLLILEILNDLNII